MNKLCFQEQPSLPYLISNKNENYLDFFCVKETKTEFMWLGFLTLIPAECEREREEVTATEAL